VTTIEPWLREILRCPSCGGPLQDVIGPAGGPELRCTGCSLAYRVDDSIPVLLVEEARDDSGAGPAGAVPAGADEQPPGADGQAGSGEPRPGRE